MCTNQKHLNAHQQGVNIAQAHAWGHAPLSFMKGCFGQGPAAFRRTKADFVVEVMFRPQSIPQTLSASARQGFLRNLKMTKEEENEIRLRLPAYFQSEMNRFFFFFYLFKERNQTREKDN